MTYRQTVDIFRSRGTKRGSRQGKIISKFSGILEKIVEFTGQPEIIAVGVGLDTIGKFESGDNIGGIVGGVIGDLVGQQLGGEFEKRGETIGKQIGGFIGSENHPKEKNPEPTDRTHNDQLADQITENQHTDDKEQHHPDIQAQTDLTANSNSGIIGSSLLENNIDKLTNNLNIELNNEILQLTNVNDVLGFISRNLGNINNLSNVNENRVFDELIATGFLNSILAN